MRVAFFGTPEFGRVVLEALIAATDIDVVLVVSQPDRPRQRRGRGGLEPSPVTQLAREQKLPVAAPARAADVLSELEQADPDVCVVAAYGQILPEQLLKAAHGRWLNVHASLLPKYRGASPVTGAILDGQTETGVTIMELVPRLDAGPIVAVAAVPITDHDTTGTLSEKLAVVGGELAAKTLPEYVGGNVRPQPQDEAAATMTRTLSKADGEIDWSRDAAYLGRFVRAMQPWPGAWTTFGNVRITVTNVEAVGGSTQPGDFAETPPLIVGTGNGLLKINRLRPAGKSEMDGSDWLNGVRQAGHFGP